MILMILKTISRDIVERAKENGVNMILNAGNNINELDKPTGSPRAFSFHIRRCRRSPAQCGRISRAYR
ncbi:MAG: hypothetical protein ACLU99_07345 [Alphaproteobacteria bacterium]